VSYPGGIHHGNMYYVFKVEGNPHVLKSCLRVVQDNLPYEIRKLHPSFEKLEIIGVPSL